MHIDVPADLAAIPARLSALLQGLPDPETDALLAEIIEGTGLFDDLDDEARRTALHYHRVVMLADDLGDYAAALVDEADGSAAKRERLSAMPADELLAQMRVESAAFRKRLAAPAL
ncbi:hypothetical protein NT2_05_00900 [Caenibius tardaugens NBRC 16725]|uniref:Uncharacterized protein n=1 Tax=Caenibius tardaugens NBRC 16725 TaxID=1219035 RepID=U2ZUV5_9SPHN|nr:hypothetical protein [Caenibius tardaugens]AZI36528.1 hypothetical protein EGO55_11660 [Caenibius tardaugens NBRC 16725]GAD49169.1 hypothetical protein NT2_05_00900 [Caenibius tardaugens NBRC 16725]